MGGRTLNDRASLREKLGTDVGEPSTIQESTCGENADDWRKSMDNALIRLWRKGTLKNVALSSGKKPTKTRFVLKINYAEDGTTER